MIKIVFAHQATGFFTFQPGDEIRVSDLTPELQRLIESTRLDGAHVATIDGVSRPKDPAKVVEGDDELAIVGQSGETTQADRGRRGQRASTLPK